MTLSFEEQVVCVESRNKSFHDILPQNNLIDLNGTEWKRLHWIDLEWNGSGGKQYATCSGKPLPCLAHTFHYGRKCEVVKVWCVRVFTSCNS